MPERVPKRMQIVGVHEIQPPRRHIEDRGGRRKGEIFCAAEAIEQSSRAAEAMEKIMDTACAPHFSSPMTNGIPRSQHRPRPTEPIARVQHFQYMAALAMLGPDGSDAIVAPASKRLCEVARDSRRPTALVLGAYLEDAHRRQGIAIRH